MCFTLSTMATDIGLAVMAYLEDELSSDEEYKHCAKACALFKSRATEGGLSNFSML